MIYFITGSKHKLAEAKAILGEDKVEGLDIDLPEIQETDPHKIIAEKLEEARKHHGGEFIVEDSSLCLDALGGLPGPLIKWFLKSIGNEGLVEIARKMGEDRAQAKTLIGYSNGNGETEFFEGVVEGRIVSSSGESDFGWEPIFEVSGHGRTFAEMDFEEKNAISMRKIALEKLRNYLKN